MATNTENFYFDEFTADYYLSKDSEGVSHLNVTQKMVAVFPDFKQNKGICLELPRTNQGGKNVTLPRMTRNDISILRNGKMEPIYSIEKIEDYYEVCTGTEEYVTGRQEYTFSYEYEKVITEFTEPRSFQELYWDTNGNGWAQKFNSVTARVHLAEDVAEDFSGESWCYVGKYGEKGSEKCQITEIGDGVQFSAKNLEKYENLTFDMEFKAGSFNVPEPPVNYGLLWILIGAVLVAGIFLIFPIRKFLKTRPKREFYKGLFIKPEYQPDPKYELAEMTENYIGKKKDYKVGVLLDLVVKKKIEIVKKEGGKWGIKVLTLEGMGAIGTNLLEILNGGEQIEVGKEIKVERRPATVFLENLNKGMERRIIRDLKADGLVEEGYKFKGVNGIMGVTEAIMEIILLSMMAVFAVCVVLALIGTLFRIEEYGSELFLRDEFFPIVIIITILTVVITVILRAIRAKIEFHTEKGLVASRYMDGLKLYISMAEAERLKFLQSVEGADVSSEGIVRLYEKLLPYAAVFGLEESWMGELSRYCQVKELPEPDYLSVVGAAEMSRFIQSSSNYATSSSSNISSSGGFSSGFSGGGGGGFSGGGGGGGGGHGR